MNAVTSMISIFMCVYVFVAVEQSIYALNIVAILSISLGIPMILLAVLLLVRNQRYCFCLQQKD